MSIQLGRCNTLSAVTRPKLRHYRMANVVCQASISMINIFLMTRLFCAVIATARGIILQVPVIVKPLFLEFPARISRQNSSNF